MSARVITGCDFSKPYGEDEIYSEREYDHYTFSAVLQPDEKYDRAIPTQMSLYVDSETGVVVFDIEKYEKSLKN